MPIVPSQEDKISTDVPGLDVGAQRFGQAGAALANAGTQLESTASTVAEHVKRMEAVTTSQTASMQARLDGESQINTLKANSPDGYVYMRDSNGQYVPNEKGENTPVLNDDGSKQTISQAYHKWANDRYQQDQQSLPSDMAQQLYMQQAGNKFTTDIGLLQHDELAKRAEYSEAKHLQNLKAIAVNRGNAPNLEAMFSDFETGVKDTISQGNVGAFGADKVQPIIKQFGQEISAQQVEGEIIQVQSLMEGGTKQGALSLMLPRLQKLKEEINGNMVTDETGAHVDPESANGRRQMEGHLTLPEMLGEGQKWKFNEKIEALMRGFAPTADIGNILQQSKDLQQRYKGASKLTSPSDIAALDASASKLAANVFKTMDATSSAGGTPKLSPLTAMTDVFAPLMGAKIEGKLNSDEIMLQNPNKKYALADSAEKQIWAGGAGVINELNQHEKNSEYRLLPGEGIDAVRNALHDSTQATIKSQNAKMHENFGAAILDSKIGARLGAKTLDAVDVKTTDDFTPITKTWLHGVDTMKKVSGAYNSSANFPPQITTDLANRIKDLGQNPEQQAKLMGNLNDSGGQRLIQEMADQGKIPYQAQFANMLKPGAREDWMQAHVNGKVIQEQYNAKYSALNSKAPDNTADTAALTGMAEKYFGPQFIAAAKGSGTKLGGNPTQVAMGMRDTVVTKAMQNYVTDGGKQSPEDYIKGAGADYMKNWYSPSKTPWYSNSADRNIPLPKNGVVGDPVYATSGFPKTMKDDSGNQHYLTPTDNQSIANFVQYIKKNGSQLVDKYGAVDPKMIDPSTGHVNPKSDVAPEDYKYFLNSGGAKLQEHLMFQNGQWGVGFRHEGTTGQDTQFPGKFAQMVDIMKTGKDGVPHKLFIPLSEANAVGKGIGK